MLQLEEIRKTYHAGGFEQAALDGVSITFRDSEFVAILGPSGSGKTTLLNIIGGLDHYDSGDLSIDGVSTSRFSDRDWDAYRNNRIGFVFQTYNLISHQTVLANVELALTLSGVGRAERTRRAMEALEHVGLSEHARKLPSQLSGGQMQRVAIARALINDPEILLADEPTGALDSKTSLAVMDLLTQIANDRLVIMVTHNAELADQYANRIVSLQDGQVTGDTRPYGESDEQREARPARRTSMSFVTAIALSFKNLMTKKGRTMMTSFAGSIGIIGIATILALANGINAYIRDIEESTLSLYPLTIQTQGIDLSSLLGGGPSGSPTDAASSGPEVHEVKRITSMFGSVGNNDLGALKSYLDSPASGIQPYVNSVQYNYDITPQIYADTTDPVRQVNPNQAFAPLGIGSGASSSSLMSMGMSMNVFSSLPDNLGLVTNQYDVVAGRWPQSYNECLLVLSGSGGVSDLLLYAMGLRDPAQLDQMVQDLANNKTIDAPSDMMTFTYDQLMGVTFKLIEPPKYWEYDAAHSVWMDMRGDSDYMAGLVDAATTMHIVGVVKPSPTATATMLNPGLYYPSSLTQYLIDYAASSPIVQDQLDKPDIDVLTNKTFADEAANPGLGDFDFASLISVDQSAIASLFNFDFSGFKPNINLDFSKIMTDMPKIPPPDIAAMLAGIKINADPLALYTIMTDTVTQFLSDVYGITDPSQLTALLANPPTPQEVVDAFTAWVQQPDIQSKLTGELYTALDVPSIEAQVAKSLQTYMQQTMTTVLKQLMTSIQSQLQLAMRATMSQLMSYMAKALNIDPAKLANIFKFNMNQTQMQALLTSMLSTRTTYSQDANLRQFGYADLSVPYSIDIYPKDFSAKQSVLDILNGYNTRMTNSGQDDKVITYTDVVGTLMSSVTDIISKVSAVLVAFVSISLLVSSIMIGVITYISVLERTKEIGILRALGASKRNVGNVFNAETLIIGFIAGFLGVAITVLLTMIANPIVANLYAVNNIAQLPVTAALALIGISMLLTFLAGLIPSSAASRRDPVEALRTE